MRFSLIALSALLLASGIAAGKTPPTKLQIGVKARNPDPNCAKAKDGDRLWLHYTGTLWTTGAVFDSSAGRGDLFNFKLGHGEVIKGWDQGLRGMCVGEKRKLTIPANLAYGNRVMGSIPANSILNFEVELVKMVDSKDDKDEL
ncbi:MAG: hypothetical protein J3Q66DRAFT_387448 [Benniella sp.]|nr:MAG: hypothetical protein J3Q66DRAFT_387448 [Benniella sp.]